MTKVWFILLVLVHPDGFLRTHVMLGTSGLAQLSLLLKVSILDKMFRDTLLQESPEHVSDVLDTTCIARLTGIVRSAQ